MKNFILLVFFCSMIIEAKSQLQTESEIKVIIKKYYLETSNPDPIVGIYNFGALVENYKFDKLVSSESDISKSKVAFYYEGNKLLFCYFDHEGKYEATKMTAENHYMIWGTETVLDLNDYSFISGCKWESTTNIAKFYNFSLNDAKKSGVSVKNCIIAKRYFPNNVDLESFKKDKKNEKLSSTGTGFAIATNGYIITNHHVVYDAEKISVKGINGDFSKSHTAKVISADKNNDLAILKIDNIEIKDIPFSILATSISVGEDVFTLGFPLTATMGEEVKLTNGIISSKSGFQGDITSYQTSIPVQPGNSGGPVFNSDGNLIAVITSKHLGTDNVSYAIKSIYINALIDSVSEDVKLPTGGKLAGVKLSEQVKQINKFVYLIEVN